MNAPEVEPTPLSHDNDITAEIPGILRAVAVGSTIGLVSVFVAVGGAVYLSQHDIAGALALGSMSAFWGGLGFGAMLGGTLHVVRHSDQPHGSTAAPPSEGGTRPRRIAEVPRPGSSRAAERTPDDEPRSERTSSQVA